jgi:hypothetical protein
MKHFYLILIMLCFGVAGAQLSHFDSSYVLLSSQTYDVLNASFYKGTESFPYSFSSNWQAMMVYERGGPQSRNIAVRVVGSNSLGQEILITNDSLMNRNAAIAHTKRASTIRKALTLFETHQQGSVKLRYSYYDGSYWSPALHIPADVIQSNSPSVTNLGTDTSSSFLAVYAARSAVYLRRFDNGAWGRQFKVSPFDSTVNCSHPAIISNDFFSSSIGRAHVAFNYDSSGISRIMYLTLTSYNSDSIVINSSQYLIQPGAQRITGFSRDYNFYPVLNYDYTDQLVRRFYSAVVKPPSPPSMFQQEDLPGDDYMGSGTALSIITNDLSSYIAGCWLNLNGDSTLACCKHTYFAATKHRISSSVNEKRIAISPLLPSSILWKPMIIIVWNDMMDGKYILKASQGTFDLGKISGQVIVPGSFALHQNYPNPFNPSTKISYELQMSGYISFKIHNIAGREIDSPVNARQNAGSYEFNFSSDNLPSGVYFYSMYIDGVEVASRKMVVLK